MSDTTLSHEQLLNFLDVQANESLRLWDLPEDAEARLINVSENATYLVESANGSKAILRIHRDDYHTLNAIKCEHAWSDALNAEGGIITPGIMQGRDGNTIQTASVDGLPGERHMAMFEYVEGKEPDESEDLLAPFEGLGEIAAKTHLHTIAWQRPENFERMTWNLQTMFGKQALWEDWHDAPNVTSQIRSTLEQAQTLVETRLNKYGQSADRYGLIHADMRLANLLISDGVTRLIDFDDCGEGWFMYDFAAGISFMEDSPQIPALKDAWLRGYRRVRELSVEDVAEIDTFIMLRRLALLAWIGSHIEVDTAQELAPDFAIVSAELAQIYLSENSV